MSLYTRFLELSVKNYEPYFFANYLIQLANKFHILYEKEKFLDKDKISSSCKISIVKAIQQLITNGLDIFGINVIENM